MSIVVEFFNWFESAMFGYCDRKTVRKAPAKDCNIGHL